MAKLTVVLAACFVVSALPSETSAAFILGGGCHLRPDFGAAGTAPAVLPTLLVAKGRIPLTWPATRAAGGAGCAAPSSAGEAAFLATSVSGGTSGVGTCAADGGLAPTCCCPPSSVPADIDFGTGATAVGTLSVTAGAGLPP